MNWPTRPPLPRSSRGTRSSCAPQALLIQLIYCKSGEIFAVCVWSPKDIQRDAEYDVGRGISSLITFETGLSSNHFWDWINSQLSVSNFNRPCVTVLNCRSHKRLFKVTDISMIVQEMLKAGFWHVRHWSKGDQECHLMSVTVSLLYLMLYLNLQLILNLQLVLNLHLHLQICVRRPIKISESWSW